MAENRIKIVQTSHKNST